MATFTVDVSESMTIKTFKIHQEAVFSTCSVPFLTPSNSVKALKAKKISLPSEQMLF